MDVKDKEVLGELAMKAIEQVEDEFPDGSIGDAMIIMEVFTDYDDQQDEYEYVTTKLVCTSKRPVIQTGLVEQAFRVIDEDED